MKQVWIVIPAHNEQATLAQVIKGIRQYVDQVVVVNDASTDITAQVAKQMGVNLISNQRNLGYAKSLERGLRLAFAKGASYCICWDADGQHVLKNLPKILTIIKSDQPDIIVGKRQQHNRWMERVWGIYSRFRFGFSDPLCGLKAYSHRVWERYGYVEGKYTIATELLFKAVADGMTWREVEVAVKRRVDQSRFGNSIKGNWLELRALVNVVFGRFLGNW